MATTETPQAVQKVQADKDPKLMSIGGTPIFNQPKPNSDAEPYDRTWLKMAFMVSDRDIGDATNIVNRYWSSASDKFTDSSIGGNIGINPRPQWTPYSDIRVPGRLAQAVRKEAFGIGTTTTYLGMGRSYSEGIDDPAQKIFLRFGVPRFTSLTAFLTRAFNREQMIIAKTGRAPTAWYSMAKVVGTAIPLMVAPTLTIAIGVGKAASWLFARPSSKFFTVKPTMHSYWATVNSLVNNHAVNEGLFAKILNSEEQQKLGKPYKIDETSLAALSAMLPDVISKYGYLDIYAMANRAQRMANAMFSADFDKLDKGTATDFLGYLNKRGTGDGTHTTYISDSGSDHTLAAYFNKLTMIGDYTVQPDVAGSEQKDSSQEVDTRRGDPGATDSYLEQLAKNADALFRDGADFACFRVDHTGSVSESFGNTTGESEISQKFNDTSAKFREVQFNMAGGNLVGDTNPIGNAIQSFMGSAVDVGMGLLDGATLGLAGLLPGLGGGGYIDVPKHWQSSSASLPRGQYTMQLVSPYGNVLSRMFNIWIPFYMILAGALPRSTGTQSYTSPFYCSLYDRGRLTIRTGMIESISVTRGTTNLPFSNRGIAYGIDVTFTVVDLSSIMHMPVSSGNLLESETLLSMDEDNILCDYLNTLAGLDIYSQIYPFPKAQLKLTKELLGLKRKATSSAYHASLFKNAITDGWINDISFGISGGIYNLGSAFARGNATLEGERN